MLPKAKSSFSKALIVEGGGMKGAFSGGVLACMCQFFPKEKFDLVIGVSSGSCSSAYYVLDSNGENSQRILDIWKHELHGNKFISFWNPLKNFSSIMNQAYLIEELFQKKYRLPVENFNSTDTPPFFIVVSDLKREIPRYLQATKENIFSLLKAATALPIATRGKYWFEGSLLGDGGALDPIPIEEVIKAGYKDITIVLNHPKTKFSEPISKFLSKLAFPFEKNFARKIRYYHHLMYNKAKSFLLHPPPEVKIEIIAPEKSLPLGVVTTNIKKLHYAVYQGWKKAYNTFARGKD